MNNFVDPMSDEIVDEPRLERISVAYDNDDRLWTLRHMSHGLIRLYDWNDEYRESVQNVAEALEYIRAE